MVIYVPLSLEQIGKRRHGRAGKPPIIHPIKTSDRRNTRKLELAGMDKTVLRLGRHLPGSFMRAVPAFSVYNCKRNEESSISIPNVSDGLLKIHFVQFLPL